MASRFSSQNENQNFKAQDPSICEIEGPDKSLCPIRALRIFMRKRERATYYVNDRCLWPRNQAALTTLLVKLVKDSVRHAKKIPSMNIGPHQFRKLAASLCYNFFPKVQRKLLPLRMGSAALTVLKRAYIRLLGRPGIACVAPLGTVSPAG